MAFIGAAYLLAAVSIYLTIIFFLKTENSISSVILIFIDSVTVVPYTNKKTCSREILEIMSLFDDHSKKSKLTKCRV